MFKLVILASKRALELAEGSPKLVEALPDTKVTTLAMLEIAEDKVEMGKPKVEEK
jgi:DNA-directed RNA polymerase omega subunit